MKLFRTTNLKYQNKLHNRKYRAIFLLTLMIHYSTEEKESIKLYLLLRKKRLRRTIHLQFGKRKLLKTTGEMDERTN